MEIYIWAALLGALLQGFAFAMARQLLVYSNDRTQIVFYGMLVTVLMALTALPFMDIRGIGPAPELIVGFSITVVLSQILLMESMKRADASFVVPMLGVKIFVVALVSALIWQETYSGLVYLGAIGTLISLYFLNDGKLQAPAMAVVFVLLAAVAYAGNDLFLMSMIRSGYNLGEVTIFSLVGPLLLLGPIAIIKSKGSHNLNWRYSRALLLFGFFQITSIFALIWAFELSRQVTMVTIVQNSRAIFALLAVWLFGRFGFSGVEQLTGSQYRSRLIGAMIMMVSLGLAISAK
ncbi:MAG: EamA family transporter [Immundisolibacteraceae bacterium]|nr:EamA family transporter [Immundisolibacteraceae bacterium]